MAKGVSIAFKSYEETIPKILNLIGLEKEMKKHHSIIIKPFLSSEEEKKDKIANQQFVEQVLKFCLEKKNPVGEVFIAEGADGEDTMELFNKLGYTQLAEKYSVGLIDLNNAEIEPQESAYFTKFSEVFYPKVLKDSFVISLAKPSIDEEFVFAASLSNMLGAYPSKFYRGFFSRTKNKIRKWSVKYSIHDIIQCKMPELSLIDASEKGKILAGFPLEIDKQAAKLFGLDWKTIGYLRLLEQNWHPKVPKEEKQKKEVEMPQLIE